MFFYRYYAVAQKCLAEKTINLRFSTVSHMQAFHQKPCGFGEVGIFFRDHEGLYFHLGVERDEFQITPFGVHKLCQSEGIAESLLNHICDISH